MPLFHRADWLDAVSETWTASADDWESPSYVWPYDSRKRYGFAYLCPPVATPRLGPLCLRPNCAPPPLPHDWGYGWYTLRAPRDLWHVPTHARAMATLTLDLTAPRRYSKTLRKRLRRGQGKLAFATAADDAWEEIAALASAPHAHVAPGTAAAVWRARQSGRAQVYEVRSPGGRLEGVTAAGVGVGDAHMLFLVRATTADSDVGAVLQAGAIADLRSRGVAHLDFLAGNLPGPREFMDAFGASAEWYAQVRVSRSPLWSGLEWVRSRTNRARI